MRTIRNMRLLYPIVTKNYNFDTKNLNQMFNELDGDDKKTFNFVHIPSWEIFVDSYYKGIRKYLLKESPDTIPKAQKKLAALYRMDSALKIVLVFPAFYSAFLLLN